MLSHYDFRAHRLLVQTIGERAYDIVMDISPDDPMFSGHRGTYMFASASALEWIMSMLDLEREGEVRSILDMGSGYGRVTRSLRATFPDASITACDTDPAAVEFCRRMFDANAITADEDPSSTELDGEFDLIWAGSLLPRLPVERWPGMLDLLGRHLREDGLLILTTLAWQSSPILRGLGVPEKDMRSLWQDYEARGFAHQSRLETNGSRLTLTAPGWVRWVVHSSKLLRVARQRESVWDTPRPREDVIACVHPFRSDA
jgi:SAM-dependent methyltransferase